MSRYNLREHHRETNTSTIEMIYKNPDFMAWREELLLELSRLKKDSFIEEIIGILQRFNGFGDATRLDKVESKLRQLKDKLEEYVIPAAEIVIDDERIPEKELVETITRILLKLQRNHTYSVSSSENEMNDYVRDILDETYDVYDQTRQGESEEGNDAGEVDIQIRYEGLPVVMIEGLILKSVSKKYLNDHVTKVLTKYDPNGCPYVIVLVYATAPRLESFYKRFLSHLNEYQFPFTPESDIIDINTSFGEIKHAQIILLRNEKQIGVHFFVVHIV